MNRFAPPILWGMTWLILVAPALATAQSAPAGPDLTDEVEIRESIDGDETDFEGLPLVAYELRCDLHLCSSPDAITRFQEISGLTVGQEFTEARLQRAQQRLAKTGFFDQLTVERRIESGGVAVDIDARGATLIRRIRFEGLNPPPFENELRKVLMFRSGQVFRDDPEQIDAQLQSLETLFEREGYFGSIITLEVHPVGTESHLVDLIFSVERGEDRRICTLGFRGVRAMTTAEAREKLLSGVSVLARRVPVFLPMFTTDQFRNGREALIQEYRHRGYFRARIVDQAVQVDERSRCVSLLVDVNEGPFWGIEFVNNRSVPDADLREELPFASSGYVDADEIRRAENALRQVYEARGYPFAVVVGEEIVTDRLDRRLVFTVEEGPRVQIDAVVLHGVTAFPHRDLLSRFGTQPFGLFEAGGFLQSEQLLADIADLEHQYRQAGYMQVLVETFAIELNARGDAITIHVHVQEGEQTVVERVRFVGEIDTAPLGPLLQIRAGRPFVPIQLRADHSRLTQHFGARGYPRARIDTYCHADGIQVPCESPRMPPQCLRTSFEEIADGACQWRDGDSTSSLNCERRIHDEECTFEGGVTSAAIHVTHRVLPGPPFRVGEILLKGNFRTRSGVIFRELPLQTGDVFDVQKLIEGQGNMRSLGLFDSVSIETIGLDEEGPAQDEQSAALIISVEESRSRFLDFRFGVEGRDLLSDSRRLLLTGETQYTNNNLLGSGQRLRPRLIGALDTLQIGRLTLDSARDVDAASDVTGLDVLFGAELIYNHPRFLKGQLGVDQLHLTITPFYLLDQLGVVAAEQVLREEWGLRMEFRKELFEWLDRFFLTFGVEAKQAATWTPNDTRVNGERLFSPRRATGKLVPELTLDRRDSPLNPTRGFHLQIQPQLVSGDALGQGGEDLIGDSYWRVTFNASAFLRFWNYFVFGQGLRVGQIIPLFDRQTLVPPDEAYFLGGVGSIRGFPSNILGPIGGRQQPTGGEFLVNYNAELRYPLIADWSVYGATFFDVGLLVDCVDPDAGRSTGQCYRNAFPDDDPLQQVRAGAGIGLRYLIVDQIPLLFDYGMVLNRRPGERFGSFHFNLGYTF